MKKQVVTYVKPAKELAAGDRILTSRITVADVKSMEQFADANKRRCVEIRFTEGTGESVVIFVADDIVMVLE